MNESSHRISLARAWRREDSRDAGALHAMPGAWVRIFKSPTGLDASTRVLLKLSLGPDIDSILLNAMPLPWCKLEASLEHDITSMIRSTNRLQVWTNASHRPETSHPPLDAWLEITNR